MSSFRNQDDLLFYYALSPNILLLFLSSTFFSLLVGIGLRCVCRREGIGARILHP